MYNSDTELLFPPRVIPALRNLRGDLWQKLVDHLAQQESASLDLIAFVLLMARLGGCGSCNADSYRALKGCTHCAQQTVRRYRGSDQELKDMYLEARHDAEQYLRQDNQL
jgi:hypothetical protein